MTRKILIYCTLFTALSAVVLVAQIVTSINGLGGAKPALALPDFRAAGAAGEVFTGKVARSAEALNTSARTMRVEVDMPNVQHALVPGMYVTVGFRLPVRGNVVVPAAALIFRADGPQVAKVGADDKVRFERVTIGRDDGSNVELASGVAPGDRLVLNISSQIAADQVVSIKQEAPGK